MHIKEIEKRKKKEKDDLVSKWELQEKMKNQVAQLSLTMQQKFGKERRPVTYLCEVEED